MKYDLTVRGQRVHVKTGYAPTLVARFKNIPGRLFHSEDKTWSFPTVRDVLLMLCDALGILPMFLPPPLRVIARPEPENFERLQLDLSCLDSYRFLTPPYEHQKKNLVRLLQHQRWLLADEMGTGKSHAIVNRLRFYPNDEYWPALIVCPKSVVYSWIEQLAEHGELTPLTAGGYESCARIFPLFGIVVANYERLLQHDYTKTAWRTIIFDEIHRVKNLTARVSRVAQKLSANAQYVYGLSGTPAPNGLEDWLGVLSVIDPKLLPCQTKRGFEDRYCVKEWLGDKGFKVIKGYRNVHELHAYICQVTSRVTKEECLDLPEKLIAPRLVRLSKEQYRVYSDLKNDAVARLRSAKSEGTLTVKNILTESLRLLQVAGGFVPDDDGCVHGIDPNGKMEALLDLLDEIPDKQVVVWAVFREEVEYIAALLSRRGSGVAVLHGDTADRDRERAIESFAQGQAQYFVGSPGAGGVGVNGLQVCDTEVYYSRNWSLTDWLQSQDRLHRIGQKNNVTVVPLVASGTVDQKVGEALQRKASLQEMMLQAGDYIESLL